MSGFQMIPVLEWSVVGSPLFCFDMLSKPKLSFKSKKLTTLNSGIRNKNYLIILNYQIVIHMPFEYRKIYHLNTRHRGLSSLGCIGAFSVQFLSNVLKTGLPVCPVSKWHLNTGP